MEEFIKLLTMHSIAVICDVRSVPYSQYASQFNKELINKELQKHNIRYVFLGKELGVKSDNPRCYANGRVQYKCLAQEPLFNQGINRLLEGIKNHRVTLMCAEKDPMTCHRTILICRHLRSKCVEIKHILEDGKIEYNTDLEQRLLGALKLPQYDLFTSQETFIEMAYDMQGEKIAYVDDQDRQDAETVYDRIY